jgi:hypothetical protein
MHHKHETETRRERCGKDLPLKIEAGLILLMQVYTLLALFL